MQAETLALTSEFLESLTKVSRKIRTAFNQRVTAHGLTYPRARALLRLSKRDRMMQSELACELELEQATMVRLLDRMEEHGLIRREPDPADRRAKHISLTEHGREQAARVLAIGETMRREIFEGVDAAALAQSITLLEDIFARINVLESGHVQK